jgi:hypothetical protein
VNIKTPRRRRTFAAVVGTAALGMAAAVFGIATANAATAGPITGLGGKCVDVASASSANGAHVQLFDCNGTGAQTWTIGDDGTIKALGKCMDVTAASTTNGAKIQIYDCNGTNAQKWAASSGALVNTGSGKCLDATGNSSANGNQLQIWSCTGAANQKWTMPGAGPAPTTAAPTTAPPTTAPPTGGFVHPGVLDSRASLDFVKAKVAAKQQPWLNAYNQMLGHNLLSQSRQPKPRATVECGSYSNPDYGCTDERQDALAAYGNALAWYISGDAKYAQKAIQYMNAWAPVIKSHTNSNAKLQTGWAGSSWPRAAEIIRYTYTGWAQADIDRFATMLRTVYLPTLLPGVQSNGNWELTMMEAAVGISVFLNDRTSYNAAISKFLGRVPAYVYLTSDGAYPKAPPGSGLTTRAQIASYWQGQNTFVDGLAQETCRDLVHTGYGLANIEHVAETTRIQGNDLWPSLATRMAAALEFHSNLELGAAVPSWLCGGKVTRGLGPATEVGLNALTRLGVAAPKTKQLTESRRPAQTNVLFIGWDTLTHANNPN